MDIEGTKLCLQNVNPIKKVGLKNKYIRVDLIGSKNESILKVGKVGKTHNTYMKIHVFHYNKNASQCYRWCWARKEGLR